MEEDLLKKTQNQVIDLIHHGFYKEAETICLQAEKVFENRSIKQLRTVAAIGLKDWVHAEEAIAELLKSNPTASDFNNLSIVKKNQNLLEEAKKYASMAIQLNFNNPLYFANISSICWLLGEKDLAFEYLDKALTLKDSDIFWQYKATYYTEDQKFKEAVDCYKKAIELENKSDYYVEIFYILAKQKKYELCWQFYEHRYNSMPQVKQVVDRIKIPILHKDADPNAKIAIFYEQGLGDCIMFMRFLQKFCEIYINAYLLDTDEGMKNITKDLGIKKNSEITQDTDFIVGLMSLPYHLNIDIIPEASPAYIHKKAKSDIVKVGIVWAGGPYHPSDDIRSAYLRDFEQILSQSDWEIYSFMKDKRKRKRIGSDEIIDYAEGFDNYKIIDLGPEIVDIKSTLELLDQVDCLITVDTAMAHIAGIKNMPVYLMISDNSDWRWGTNESFSDWYPNTRIFKKRNKESYKVLCEKIVKTIRGEFSPPCS